MPDSLTENQLNYLMSQEKSLEAMINIIKELPRKNLESLREIETSIEVLNRDAKTAKAEDIPAIMQQLNTLHNLAKKLSEGDKVPDLNSPYFGHLKINQEGKTKDLYIGHIGMSSTNLDGRIVDWKKAPIAQVYYQYGEGEDFDLDLEDREIEGQVIEKSVLTIVDGKLYRVDREGSSFVKVEGKWQDLYQEKQVLEGGEGAAYGEFGTGRTNFDSPDVISLLDQTQYNLVNKDARKPLLIIGGAGSGKTTVALYRLARLIENRRIFPNQTLTLVPNIGLVKLSEALLEKVGIRRPRVKVLDSWIEDSARNLVRGLPKRVKNNAPLSVTTIKRHKSMKVLLQNYVNSQNQIAEKEISSLRNDNLTRSFEGTKTKPILERLNLLEAESLDAMGKLKVKDLKTRFSNYREDLHHIFTDSEGLKGLVNLAPEVITQRMVDDFKMYTAKSLSGHDHDREYLEAGETSDYELENNDKIDREDFVLILSLMKMKKGMLSSEERGLRKFKHIVLDEAQEVTPMELEIISEFIHEKGSITVAGDAVQQIDPSMSFSSWQDTMGYLGYADVEVSELNVSYRSPKSIVEFAHHVLGPLAPEKLPSTNKLGGPVIQTEIQHSAHASLILNDALRDLTIREDKASIAIICNKPDTAREYHNILQDLGNVRLVLDSDFSFKPGIDVTCVDHIRGLEFDYVIIPDANRSDYPIMPRARKRLHLAATRAIHQLWVLYGTEKSPLIG